MAERAIEPEPKGMLSSIGGHGNVRKCAEREIARLTGVRLRELPFSPERVKGALNA